MHHCTQREILPKIARPKLAKFWGLDQWKKWAYRSTVLPLARCSSIHRCSCAKWNWVTYIRTRYAAVYTSNANRSHCHTRLLLRPSHTWAAHSVITTSVTMKYTELNNDGWTIPQAAVTTTIATEPSMSQNALSAFSTGRPRIEADRKALIRADAPFFCSRLSRRVLQQTKTTRDTTKESTSGSTVWTTNSGSTSSTLNSNRPQMSDAQFR